MQWRHRLSLEKSVDDEGCLTGVAGVAVDTAVVVALDAMATIVAGAPAGMWCQLGGGSSGGCVGRSSRSGSHHNHFFYCPISFVDDSCLCLK